MIDREYLRAIDISNALGVSSSKAYAIIKQMNNELKAQGYLTISGKVPRVYFEEKWYGGLHES